MVGAIGRTTVGLFILAVSVGGAWASDPASGLFSPSVYDWSGAYFGVHAGGKISSETEFHSDDVNGDTNLDIAGGAVGIYAGYNWQRGRWVIGLEGDVSAVFSADDARTVQVVTGGGLVASRYAADLTFNGNLRARLGYAFNRVLPFVAVGVSAARYEAEIVIPTVGRESEDALFVEYSLGAGIDYALRHNILLRIEYIYEHFDREDVFSIIDVEQALKPHIVRGGVAVKFGAL